MKTDKIEHRTVSQKIIVEAHVGGSISVAHAVAMLVRHAMNFIDRDHREKQDYPKFIAELIGIIVMVKGFYQVLDEIPDLSDAKQIDAKGDLLKTARELTSELKEIEEKFFKKSVH